MGGCHECGSPFHVVLNCPERRKRKVLCHNCKQSGHYAGDCPAKQVKCFGCGIVGHYAGDCPNKQNSHSNVNGVVNRDITITNNAPANNNCYGCGKSGHRLSECPNPVNKACHKCGKLGHKMSNCPSSSVTSSPSSSSTSISSSTPCNSSRCYICDGVGHLAVNCEERKCVICKDKPKEYIVLPCAHFQYCGDCVKRITKCATCREHIVEYKKAFT